MHLIKQFSRLLIPDWPIQISGELAVCNVKHSGNILLRCSVSQQILIDKDVTIFYYFSHCVQEYIETDVPCQLNRLVRHHLV